MLKKLTADEIKPVLSAFLLDGWLKQRYEIADVECDAKTLLGRVNVIEPPPSPGDDPKFYLSNTIALTMLAQLGIVHSHMALGIKKEMPVWLRDFHVDNHWRVRNPTGIRIRLQCFELFDANFCEGHGPPGVRTNYRARFDIEEGSFTGNFWLVFRRPGLGDR